MAVETFQGRADKQVNMRGKKKWAICKSANYAGKQFNALLEHKVQGREY